MKKPRIVEVTWGDAHQDTRADFRTADELDRENPVCVVENVGYLALRTKEKILVAQSYRIADDDEDKPGEFVFRDVMVVPADMLIRVRTLK